jgi:hypothetical protein
MVSALRGIRRRRTVAAVESQAEMVRRALEAKRASEPDNRKPDDRTPKEGMHPIENKDQAPSGALDHGGQHPAMQRSKFARQ